MDTILPYTVFKTSSSRYFRVPPYARAIHKTSMELIYETIPPYLHGSQCVIANIHDYLGKNAIWTRVDACIKKYIQYRHRDVMFTYSVLSNLDPVRRDLRLPEKIALINDQSTYIRDAASTRIPFIFDHISNDMYYRTRTGHLGMFDELQSLETIICLQGRMTTIRPTIDIARMLLHTNCLVITNDSESFLYWENIIKPNCTNIHIHIVLGSSITTTTRDNGLFRFVILDNVVPYDVSTTCGHNDYDVVGCIRNNHIGTYIENLDHPTTTYIQVNTKPTIESFIAYLYLCKVRRNECPIITRDNQNRYCTNRITLSRTIDTLFYSNQP